ncbi:unnamed protein product [Nyctereutes procyonoides]|uniref:(raccoon dog) hypothetical protein n=1 Tax=Nyctereutes procyonoides TaxID=34880 RepID=A0A811YFJ2_NYCPR|nr:unnamed protein product [Nyctereutes procyonoides]
MCTISLMAGAGSALGALALRTRAATAGPGALPGTRPSARPHPRPARPDQWPRASPSAAAPPPPSPHRPLRPPRPRPRPRPGLPPRHPAARAPRHPAARAPSAPGPWAILPGRLRRGAAPGGRTGRGPRTLPGRPGRERAETGFRAQKWSVSRDSDTPPSGTWRQPCLGKAWPHVSIITRCSPGLSLNSSPPISQPLLGTCSLHTLQQVAGSSLLQMDMTSPHRYAWQAATGSRNATEMFISLYELVAAS